MKRTIAAIALLLSLSVLAAAGASETAETVTVWHSNTGKLGTAFDALVERFNDGIGKEKGIEIEAIYQGKANDVLTKVKATAGVSDLPEIAQLDATASLDMMNADYLYSVTELGIDTSGILPSALEALSSSRGTLAMPFNCSSLLFYYNRTLFDSLGLEPPRTLDDFIAIAPVLGEKKGEEVTRYAFAGVPTTYELCSFIGAQRGLSYLVDKENGHLGTPDQVLFGKEGTFKAFLEKWKALYDTGFVNNLPSGVSDEFASGRTASMLASSSNLSTLISMIDGRFELGTAFVPMVNEEATGGVNIGGGALYAFSDSDAVKEVLKYFTSPEAQLYWAESTGYIPVSTELFSSSEYNGFISGNPEFKVAMDQIRASNPKVTGVWIPSAYQIYYSFQSTVRSVTEKGLSIDEAVAAMEKEVASALEEYSRQNR